MLFDYEEARKAGKTEAPAEFAEKCRNRFHHRDTEDTLFDKEAMKAGRRALGMDSGFERPEMIRCLLGFLASLAE